MGSIEIKKQLIDRGVKLPINSQCSLLSIIESTYYCCANGENSENKAIVKMMDGHI